MKTLIDLQNEVLRYFDLADEESDSADVVLVRSALNTAHQKRCTEDNWRFLLSNQFTLPVTAGTQEYILPHYNFGKPYFLYSSTNKRYAMETPLRMVPESGISVNEQLDADTLYYEVVPNGSVVAAQPSSASALTLTSSTAEPNAPELYIEGEDSSGGFISASLAKNGVSSDLFSKVTYYAKTADFNGTLTLTGGSTLVTLTSTQYAKQYPLLKWHNIPNSSETFVYRFFKSPRVMSRDFDIPDLPFPHSNVLVFDTLLQLATYNEIDSESINIWRNEQQEHLTNLYLYKLAGNTIAGYGNYINSGQ